VHPENHRWKFHRVALWDIWTEAFLSWVLSKPPDWVLAARGRFDGWHIQRCAEDQEGNTGQSHVADKRTTRAARLERAEAEVEAAAEEAQKSLGGENHVSGDGAVKSENGLGKVSAALRGAGQDGDYVEERNLGTLVAAEPKGEAVPLVPGRMGKSSIQVIDIWQHAEQYLATTYLAVRRDRSLKANLLEEEATMGSVVGITRNILTSDDHHSE
jgi:hypothetical protein